MIAPKPTVLVVEDDIHARELYLRVFESEGCNTLGAESVHGALRLIDERKIDLAVIDYWLLDGTGADIMRSLLKNHPGAQAIIVTASDDDHLRDQMLKGGAYSFLRKPVNLDVMTSQSRRALQVMRLNQENDLLHTNLKDAIEELDLRRREIEAIGRITSLVDAASDSSDQGKVVLSIVSEFFGKDVALAYFNVSHSGDEFVLRYHLGLTDAEVSSISLLDTSGGLLGVLNGNREPFGSENLKELPIGYNPEKKAPVYLESLKTAFALPIISRGRLLGVLVTGYRHQQSLVQTERVLGGAVGRQLRMAMEHIHVSEIATKDSLTNLYNRGYFESRLIQEFSRAKRHNHALTVCMADLDGFKELNDTYGHAFGDRVLQEICKSCKKEVRESDFAARYGGEEFALILPETSLEGGEVVAEKVRESVENLSFLPPDDQKGEPIRVTISIGLASYPEYGDNAKEIVQWADQALYHVKLQGGNKVFSVGRSGILDSAVFPKELST
jgi:diguanylate cyclase (GGDEF)-like protein